MNAYQIVALGFFVLVLLFFFWQWKVRPFLDDLARLKDEKIRADFEFCKRSQTSQHWSKSAKFLLDEVRQLKRFTVLCGFDAKNRVAMTEELIRKEVAVITEVELQKALLDAQRELVSAARSGIFDGDTLTGLSWEYFERVGAAYRELDNAGIRLASIMPKEEADMSRFKESFLGLALAND